MREPALREKAGGVFRVIVEFKRRFFVKMKKTCISGSRRDGRRAVRRRSGRDVSRRASMKRRRRASAAR